MKKIAFVAVLIAVIVFGIVAYASAASPTDSKGVTVTAAVNPKFVMSLSGNGAGGPIDLLAADPNAANLTATGPAVLVKSNKGYTWTASFGTLDNAAFSHNYAAVSQHPAGPALPGTDDGGDTYTGVISFDPSYALEGTYTGTLTFTAEQ